jgi:phosphate starvation-inducible PhoH-like protein
MNIHRLLYLLTSPVLMSSLRYITKPSLHKIFSKNLGSFSVDRENRRFEPPGGSAKRPSSCLERTVRLYSSSKHDIPKPKNLAPKYVPKTPNQQIYAKHLNNPDTSIVLGIGPAGCGKTLFACITALDQLKKGKIEKIVLTRPIVPVEDEEIGFLPGNLVNKMDPWTRPMFDIILEHYQQHELTMMLKNNIIEVSPLAFMRGRTFKNCFIIADEMQNSTPNQMLMLTTRIGTNSKMVITGDLKQSDKTSKNIDNGLRDLMYKLRKPENANLDGIKMVEMQFDDIERSPIVRQMLEIYSAKDTNTKPTLQTLHVAKLPSSSSQDAALIPKDQWKEGF